MCACAELNFTLDQTEPYSSHLELCKTKKSSGKFKSIKPSKDLVLKEVQRRNDRFRANKKSRSLQSLLEELGATISVCLKPKTTLLRSITPGTPTGCYHTLQTNKTTGIGVPDTLSITTAASRYGHDSPSVILSNLLYAGNNGKGTLLVGGTANILTVR